MIKKKKGKGRKLNGIQRQKKNCKTHVEKLEKIAPAKKGTKKKAVAAIPHKEIISAYELQRKLDRYQDAINRRIDYIQMRSCAEQLARLEAQREKETLDIISSYKGMGKQTKKTNAKTSCVQKPAFTGFCAIDAILNISRVMGFEENLEDHPLCDSKLKCKKCIYRSAICKVKSGKGNRSYIEVPEIRHNMDLFLGDYFCPLCLESFDTKEETEKHKKELMHIIKPQPMKKSLENLLSSLNLFNWMKLSLTCTVCGEEMNDKQVGYVILNSQRRCLDSAFADTITNIISAHYLKQEACAVGSFQAIYPKDSIQNR